MDVTQALNKIYDLWSHFILKIKETNTMISLPYFGMTQIWQYLCAITHDTFACPILYVPVQTILSNSETTKDNNQINRNICNEIGK